LSKSLPKSVSTTAPTDLLTELRDLILDARQRVAREVNSTLMMLYWQIGARIRKDILSQQRAEYGKQILSTLSKELEAEFGSGYSVPNLSRMLALAEAFPEQEIVATLSQKLGWSHFIELLPLKQPLQREFYAEMCRIEGWSVRALREKISSALYERTALSKKPEVLIEKELKTLREDSKLTPDLVFKDPYFLDFLGLKNTYSEKNLEDAILREMERFLLEMGTGFAFVERQKRIVIDGEDFYLDLLFFHRKLKRLVLIELKLDTFKAADFGQTTLYLRWLDKYERQPGEASPIGLILCAGKSDERIELLEVEKNGIRVADYLTELPPREVLQKRLHDAITQARARLENKPSEPENNLNHPAKRHSASQQAA
jgi:predicted nuclease of restriction endonuclease-like (RecB) superfamily